MASDAATPQGPLSRRVLEFEATFRRVVADAKKKPEITPADFEPLAEFAAVDEFERIGAWMEVMTWQEYVEFLVKFASSPRTFDTTIKRISELPRLVYLEIEERHAQGDDVAVVNSLSIYQFNDAGKIRHLDIYLQHPS